MKLYQVIVVLDSGNPSSAFHRTITLDGEGILVPEKRVFPQELEFIAEIAAVMKKYKDHIVKEG